jgi:hypothetical protein
MPELLRGMDGLLEVKANPTPFKNFEVRYTTRGELELTAFNDDQRREYSVKAGRTLGANSFLSASGMQQLRTFLMSHRKNSPPWDHTGSTDHPFRT